MYRGIVIVIVRVIVILVLSQIGVMEALSANTTVGNHTLDEFGHHGYGVSPHNGRYETR